MSDKLAKLAKGNVGGKKSPASATKQVKPTEKQQTTVKQKPVVKPVEEKVLTPEEERDLKAKQMVEELLSDVEFLPKSEEIVAVEKTVVEAKTSGEGVEWLEEQVNLLTEENSALKIQLQQAKDDYSRLFNQYREKSENSEMFSKTPENNIMLLFDEFQNNYLGRNAENQRYDFIYMDKLLRKMLSVFPFLDKYRRF
jgi:hypothetical protein